jgi:hypothetical protein
MSGRVRRVVLIVFVLGAAASASGGSAMRGGLAWTAKPAVVRKPDGMALRWTANARNASKQARALGCTWFSIREERGHLDKGKFVVDGLAIRREPAAGCASGTPTKLARGSSWTSEIAAPDSVIRSDEIIRAHVDANVGDSLSFEVAAVTVTLSATAEPIIKPLAPGAK